ncbi:hypothetical protein [Blastococcus capsensis]|uniref:hypothetical protein n=1 Tax=Blastococcus capsensis TaxID=1564163 RepID=UPI00253FDB7F|nr:hypothetical protein [Blastococcus capsensis]MDK3256598.1 hypothetical protein [Blastococcus capsensis]
MPSDAERGATASAQPVATDVTAAKILSYALAHNRVPVVSRRPRCSQQRGPGFQRQASATDLPLEHVAPEEISNAMVALCRAVAGMAQDELFAQTLDVFGLRRRTSAQVAVLHAALARTIASGRLAMQPTGLVLPG